MKRRYIVIAFASASVGAVAGYIGAVKHAAGSIDRATERIYYGTGEDAVTATERLIEESDERMEVFLCAFADYRGMPPIPSGNKIMAASAIEISKSYTDMLGSLMLGANFDKDPEVRSECVRVIVEFYEQPFINTIGAIAGQLDREDDEALLKKKRELLEMVIFSNQPEVAELDTAAFKERCRQELAPFYEKSN